MSQESAVGSFSRRRPQWQVQSAVQERVPGAGGMLWWVGLQPYQHRGTLLQALRWL